MTDVCLRICAEGIRNQNPTISEEQLIESLRERIRYMKKLELEGWEIEVSRSPDLNTTC
jgi:hypothetical protein